MRCPGPGTARGGREALRGGPGPGPGRCSRGPGQGRPPRGPHGARAARHPPGALRGGARGRQLQGPGLACSPPRAQRPSEGAASPPPPGVGRPARSRARGRCIRLGLGGRAPRAGFSSALGPRAGLAGRPARTGARRSQQRPSREGAGRSPTPACGGSDWRVLTAASTSQSAIRCFIQQAPTGRRQRGVLLRVTDGKLRRERRSDSPGFPACGRQTRPGEPSPPHRPGCGRGRLTRSSPVCSESLTFLHGTDVGRAAVRHEDEHCTRPEKMSIPALCCVPAGFRAIPSSRAALLPSCPPQGHCGRHCSRVFSLCSIVPQDPWPLLWGAAPMSKCFQRSSRRPLGSGWQPSSWLTLHPPQHTPQLPNQEPQRSPRHCIPTPRPLLPAAPWILSSVIPDHTTSFRPTPPRSCSCHLSVYSPNHGSKICSRRKSDYVTQVDWAGPSVPGGSQAPEP
ncbi:uncharacterized protein LOC144291073 [Canis aureus]